ncbi:COG3014 family protein [uncultured Helicobacter sp.]|uniref:COG3014 family protein n=1 Tax=uncultured Helicobacter sp. TaxID=175537 RepID=UPI00374E784D
MMKLSRITLSFITLCVLVFGISGCSHKGTIQKFNDKYYSGDLEGAYKFAKSKYKDKDDMVLWGFESGIVASQLNNQESFALLDESERIFSHYEQEGLFSGIFSGAAAVIVNENVKTYRGNIYEGVLMNYYKALVLMKEGKNALARVEFNRANDRQRRAKDYFHKDIQKALADQEKQNSKDSNLQQVDRRHTSSAANSLLAQQYSNLEAYRAYNNFINPAVSYVSALFFMLESDWAKSLDLYKEAYGMSKAKVIDEDIQVLESRRRRDNSTYTWLIIEDGISPIKEEIAINLPTYLVSSNVLHVGVAIPKLTEGKEFYTNLHIKGDAKVFNASTIVDLEGVIANEFQAQFDFILTRAISSAILKAVTQSVLSDQAGVYGSLAGMIYSVSTTSADVRISSVLPKKIHAVQIPNVVGKYQLMGNQRPLLNLEISESCQPQDPKNLGAGTLTLCQKNDNILYIRLRPTTLSIQKLRGQ